MQIFFYKGVKLLFKSSVNEMALNLKDGNLNEQNANKLILIINDSLENFKKLINSWISHFRSTSDYLLFDISRSVVAMGTKASVVAENVVSKCRLHSVRFVSKLPGSKTFKN